MNESDTDAVLLQQLNRQRASMLTAVKSYESRVQRLAARIRDLEAERERNRKTADQMRDELAGARGEVERLSAMLAEIQLSRSWLVTAPIRRIARSVRRRTKP